MGWSHRAGDWPIASHRAGSRPKILVLEAGGIVEQAATTSDGPRRPLP